MSGLLPGPHMSPTRSTSAEVTLKLKQYLAQLKSNAVEEGLVCLYRDFQTMSYC